MTPQQRWRAKQQAKSGQTGECLCGTVAILKAWAGQLLCGPCRTKRNRKYHIELCDRNRKFVDALKTEPCVDCGRRFPPCAMDYDHRDPKSKVRSVAELVSTGRSIAAIQAEIAKCDLVCACCHRIRTHGKD